jgi:hypothetical protein
VDVSQNRLSDMMDFGGGCVPSSAEAMMGDIDRFISCTTSLK